MILEDILDGGKVEFKRVAGKPDELKLQCPFCLDERFIFGLNTKTGQAHCFHCQWKSSSLLSTIRELCKALGVKYDFHQHLVKESPADEFIPEPEIYSIALPKEYESFLGAKPDWIGNVARRYLKNRGVEGWQLMRHDIGFAAAGQYAWRILFPVYGEDGEVYGIVGRDFSGTQSPKYLNSPGLKLLWGAHIPDQTAVVVEGALDALAVERALLNTRPKFKPVARLGTAITPAQLGQLKKFQEIVILPDSDAPGVHGAIELARQCAQEQFQVKVAVPKALDDRDPGDMSQGEVLTAVDGAVLWSQATEWRLRALR